MRVYPLPPNFKESPHYQTYLGKIVLLWSLKLTLRLPGGYHMCLEFQRAHPSQVIRTEIIRARDRASVRSETIRYFWIGLILPLLYKKVNGNILRIAQDLEYQCAYNYGLPDGLRFDVEDCTHEDTSRYWNKLLCEHSSLALALL